MGERQRPADAQGPRRDCGALPFHHRDPFDRLLAAQAIDEELSIVSGDPIFRKYGVKRVW